jgi:hypothetical protein
MSSGTIELRGQPQIELCSSGHIAVRPDRNVCNDAGEGVAAEVLEMQVVAESMLEKVGQRIPSHSPLPHTTPMTLW